jgi:hypothetical protein
MDAEENSASITTSVGPPRLGAWSPGFPLARSLSSAPPEAAPDALGRVGGRFRVIGESVPDRASSVTGDRNPTPRGRRACRESPRRRRSAAAFEPECAGLEGQYFVLAKLQARTSNRFRA